MESNKKNVVFNRDLYHYLQMAIEVWPTLNSALRHLCQVKEPPHKSPVPKKNYSQMSDSQFKKTITQDLFEYIMNYDVKAQDVQDYLNDVLELMMVQEQLLGGNSNPASIHKMAHYTLLVIQQLQQGKRDKIDFFETNIFEMLKDQQSDVIVQRQKEETSDEQFENESQSSNYSDSEEDIPILEKQQKQESNQKRQQQQQRQRQERELQDDGWIIVRK